jgi:hypothetical protein
MNQPGHTDSINLVLGKTHLIRYGTGQIAHAPLMTGCMGILHFNRQGHGLDDSAQGFTQLLQSMLKFLLRPLALGQFPLLLLRLEEKTVFDGQGHRISDLLENRQLILPEETRMTPAQDERAEEFAAGEQRQGYPRAEAGLVEGLLK